VLSKISSFEYNYIGKPKQNTGKWCVMRMATKYISEQRKLQELKTDIT
jgi:hypothetical protein